MVLKLLERVLSSLIRVMNSGNVLNCVCFFSQYSSDDSCIFSWTNFMKTSPITVAIMCIIKTYSLLIFHIHSRWVAGSLIFKKAKINLHALSDKLDYIWSAESFDMKDFDCQQRPPINEPIFNLQKNRYFFLLCKILVI